MIILEKQMSLQNGMFIDEISEQLGSLLAIEGIDRRQIMRIRLSTEEVLLRWRDNDEAGICKIKLENRIGGLHLEILKSGFYCDPFEENNDDEALSRNLMANLGIAFKFNYIRNTNSVSLMINKNKGEPLVVMLIAIVSAVLLGVLLNNIFPQQSQFILGNILIPFFDCFIGFLTAVVGPAMFLSVLCGFYGIGDITTLGKIGKTLFARLLLMSLLSAVMVGIIMFFTTDISASKNMADSNNFLDVLKMILNIVPSNFVNPFLQGNVLQIIFMSVLAGFVLIILRSATHNVVGVLEECNAVFQMLLELISTVIPVFVFINILRLVLSNDIFKFGNIWWLFAVFFCAIAVWLVIQMISISIKEKVSPVIVFKKMSSTFFINLTTASSVASFSANMECCEKKFGIEKKFVKISVPLGMVMFKPATVIYFSALSVFCANAYNVPVTLPDFFTILIVSTILSVAVPPVVGGNLVCYTLLFMELNIPLEALSIAIAVDIILDFFITSFDIALLQTQILHISNKIGLLNDKILKRSK